MVCRADVVFLPHNLSCRGGHTPLTPLCKTALRRVEPEVSGAPLVSTPHIHCVHKPVGSTLRSTRDHALRQQHVRGDLCLHPCPCNLRPSNPQGVLCTSPATALLSEPREDAVDFRPSPRSCCSRWTGIGLALREPRVTFPHVSAALTPAPDLAQMPPF